MVSIHLKCGFGQCWELFTKILRIGIKGSYPIPFSAIDTIQYKEGGPWFNRYIQIEISGVLKSKKVG